MNDKQKVVFKQLQLAGLGIVIFVFGLLRTYYIKKVIEKLDE